VEPSEAKTFITGASSSLNSNSSPSLIPEFLLTSNT
jgi:hypothetical protein